MLQLIQQFNKPTVSGKYLHWDEIRYRTPPENLTHEEWWATLKMARLSSYQQIPLLSIDGSPFKYCITDKILESLHNIDSQSSGQLAIPELVTNSENRDRYIVSSLIEEAITSSQLEGASTTRRVASAMLRNGRKPVNRSEQMILNNFFAMRKTKELVGSSMTLEAILELHREVLQNTVNDDSIVGRLQFPEEERVNVIDIRDNTILHAAPPASELGDRMRTMILFANGESGNEDYSFIHPIIRAIIIHFWLAYDHPFVDGNGRLARALFYWSALDQGYWLFEFLSISNILRKAPAKYAKSYLQTETDDDDLTYFISYQIRVIERAINSFEKYLTRKTREIRDVDQLLKSSTFLNHRQFALVSHAMRHPGFTYTVKSHETSQNISNQTARSDLLDLVKIGLLDQTKRKNYLVFKAPHDLAEIIRKM